MMRALLTGLAPLLPVYHYFPAGIVVGTVLR
jgi:hypothetical protein